MRYIVVLTAIDDACGGLQVTVDEVVPCLTKSDVEQVLRSHKAHDWAVFELTKGVFEHRSVTFQSVGHILKIG